MLTIMRDIERSGGDCPIDDTARFRKDLYVLIEKALFDGKNTRGRHLNELISHMRQRFEHVTWASFNWDCIFEASFWYATGSNNSSRLNPSLAISLNRWWGQSGKDLYLKLHGGINWWMIDGRLTYLNFSSELPAKWSQYERDLSTDDFPVILEPSYYKYSDELYDLLRPQWPVFEERLRECDFVLVIGYSLPDSDSNARSALTCAFQLNSGATWAVVDPSNNICAKYRRLFGRSRLETFQSDLVSFNNGLDLNLDIAMGISGF